MSSAVASFVDGIGAASATSGILSQQQGRIFALLYLSERPLSLDEIAAELDQSKSNVSINVRVLVEWHLVRLRRVPGSRRDHYEAATDFFRAFQEIFERRFRWTVRQVLDVVGETDRAIRESETTRTERAFARQRLAALGTFFGLIDAGIGAFVRGEPFPAQKLAEVVPLSRR
jgi:DNA-binding transcriptional regulator GbsR (MarR family)